jgi:hypothetical protein
LIILHSGNFEFIAVRHRESRTLYISDILHVPHLSHPGYGKVQIGIYLEALEDAFLRNELDKNNPAPDGDGVEPGGDGPPGSGGGGGSPSNTKRKESDNPPRPQNKKPRGGGRGGRGGKRSTGTKSRSGRQNKSSAQQKPAGR